MAALRFLRPDKLVEVYFTPVWGNQIMTTREPIKIFISYRRKDSEWLDSVLRYLNPLVRSSLAEIWYDKKGLKAGDHCWPEIHAAIQSSHIAILLGSANFFDSISIMEKELPWIIDAHRKNGLMLTWIALETYPFEHIFLGDGQTLDGLEALHDFHSPLRNLEGNKINEALTVIHNKLYDFIMNYRASVKVATQEQPSFVELSDAIGVLRFPANNSSDDCAAVAWPIRERTFVTNLSTTHRVDAQLRTGKVRIQWPSAQNSLFSVQRAIVPQNPLLVDIGFLQIESHSRSVFPIKIAQPDNLLELSAESQLVSLAWSNRANTASAGVEAIRIRIAEVSNHYTSGNLINPIWRIDSGGRKLALGSPLIVDGSFAGIVISQDKDGFYLARPVDERLRYQK